MLNKISLLFVMNLFVYANVDNPYDKNYANQDSFSSTESEGLGKYDRINIVEQRQIALQDEVKKLAKQVSDLKKQIATMKANLKKQK